MEEKEGVEMEQNGNKSVMLLILTTGVFGGADVLGTMLSHAGAYALDDSI